MFSGGYKKRLVVKRGLNVTVTILNISENPMEKRVIRGHPLSM